MYPGFPVRLSGTGGLWDDPAQRPRKPIHQRRISEGAGAIRCGSKHERYGPLLRQRQDGELFCDAEEGKALSNQDGADAHGTG
ncbi:hypothetical protein SDC9_165853 [bioreactor metagenome]|uniref:Uncharacterized protein n=1 Tax=bioreactor metagenome TaxID=1076179 RepID=A0A645G300_9ZZZZ